MPTASVPNRCCGDGGSREAATLVTGSKGARTGASSATASTSASGTKASAVRRPPLLRRLGTTSAAGDNDVAIGIDEYPTIDAANIDVTLV